MKNVLGMIVRNLRLSRTDAQERGIQWEHHTAKVLDGRLQPGSGNKFYSRGDSICHGLLISNKSETNVTLAKLLSNLMEAIDLAEGSGNIPVLAQELADTKNELIVMRLSDFAKALKEVRIPEKYESPGIEKREKANTPIMLR